MRKGFLLALIVLSGITVFAQEGDRDEGEKKGFKKENLFSGGGITLGLGFGNTVSNFSIGGSPVLGYNITPWWDAGIVANYVYTSYNYKDYSPSYKVKVSTYGGGAFTKIYPVRFIYLQAQYEHNFSRQREIAGTGNSALYKSEANSFLIGGGYAGARDPYFKRPFFYIGIMADVSGDVNSPYVNAYGDAVPMIWTGLQIPLFQGSNNRRY